jgi:hypothetical protein
MLVTKVFMDADVVRHTFLDFQTHGRNSSNALLRHIQIFEEAQKRDKLPKWGTKIFKKFKVHTYEDFIVDDLTYGIFIRYTWNQHLCPLYKISTNIMRCVKYSEISV